MSTIGLGFAILASPLALLAIISFSQAAELIWRRRGQEAWAYGFSGVWFGVVYSGSFWICA